MPASQNVSERVTGMLKAEEVARLQPHYQERWLYLGIPSEKAPTRGTHLKILNGIPIQRGTCASIDRALAGRPGEEPDGLWPPGTALALAEGRISRPGETLHSASRGSTAEDREHVYLLNGKIVSRLPDATPEQLERVRRAMQQAWAALDERQGR